MRDIIEKIKNSGACSAAVVSTSDIPFEPSLIELCEMNTCGNYGKNWTCPPHVGKTGELIETAKKYKQIIVFQNIYTLEDSFDIEGMSAANKAFRVLVEQVAATCKEEKLDMLILSAGGCKICDTCTAPSGEPCRFPDRAYASLESYGIFVSKLAQAAGMNYINGQNTVTYFGGVLINET